MQTAASIQTLLSTYSRLKGDLAAAYGAPVWSESVIDRIADEIADVEVALLRLRLDERTAAWLPGTGAMVARPSTVPGNGTAAG